MGFRCAKCGKYVSDDEQYWYDNYGKYCSESCSNQAYNERAYAEEQEEVRHENAIAEVQARQEAAMRESEAQKEAAEAAQRVADTQYEAARQARLAQQDKLEHEKQMAAREARRRAHEAKLAKCILEDGVYYSPDKTAIVEVSKAVTRLVVPDYVKDISDGACLNHNDLKSVTLPEGLETIGDGSFEGCAALYDINFPKSLRKIGKEAFMDSGIEEINFPDGIKVRELPEDAFRGCAKLKNVDDMLCKIDVLGDGAFFNSGLTELTLPASIEKIAINAFGKCKNLKTLVVKEGVEHIPSYLFKNCTALTSVTLPEGVKTIGEEAFCGCTALDGGQLSLPDSLQTIGNKAFKESFNGGTLTLGGKVSEIDYEAFEKCGFSSLVIAGEIEKISRSAFAGCKNLKSVSITGKVGLFGSSRGICDGCFAHCEALESVSISGSVTELVGEMFYDCKNLKSVSISGSVKKIGERAFRDCYNIAKIDLGNAVEIIGENAFSNCKALESLTIAGNINTIGEEAFSNCKALESLTIAGNINTIGERAFSFYDELKTLSITGSINTIGEEAFTYCEQLKTLSITGSINTIGERAFSFCKNLRSLTIPGSVKTIGKEAFYSCDELKTLVIEEGVKEIGICAFKYCDKLTSVTVPSSTKLNDDYSSGYYDGTGSFQSCHMLKELPLSGGRSKKNKKYEGPKSTSEKLQEKFFSRKAKKRAIIILACLALVFLIKYAMGGEARFAKKAQKNFDSWYTSEADAIVGQTFTYNSVNSSSGEISVKTQVPFAKDGFAYGNALYTVDTAAHTVDSETRDGKKYRYAYFPDGSAYYGFNDDGSVGFVRPKEGAQFNAAQATEVIGKTFSGKWSDKFTADITFGADGTATVKFSDGDTGTGSYIASDEDNIVLYNHRDKGVWHKFVYSDDSDDVTFKRYYAEKLRNGRFDTSVSTDTHDDWKRK
ncbi:leucine-rich repeat domain-containing protein [Treponema saccharophilum]|uniref:Uncharacterized protein n=1 Tax=Treponema saccharophilum DSM 2985 TaxID=907348 RepID=H7EP27_9SPIR|nr:leucine-rich repeat domain-containing protein [Treponema saccharophilum]EIC00660.1 hypothetical protein TresaDRAFT_0133 [Treponema saccharophilum DSM 2985]BDC95750.1 hypothetical protein TRSA_08490 [Treponema saccharophilum]